MLLMTSWMSDLRLDCVNKDGFPDDDLHSSSEARLTPIFSEVGISGISELSFLVSHWSGAPALDLACDNPPIELGLCDCNRSKFLLPVVHKPVGHVLGKVNMYRANIWIKEYAWSLLLFFNWKHSVQDMIEAHYNE